MSLVKIDSDRERSSVFTEWIGLYEKIREKLTNGID